MTTDFASLTDAELCTFIADDRSGNLPDKDLDFAMSLVSSVRRRVAQGAGASDKQRHWLEVLASRTAGAEKPAGRVKSAIGDLSGVNALFDRAKAHLKAPAIVIGMGGREIRLSVAGAGARVPGSINVTAQGGDEWFGRILQDGQFEASPRLPTPPALVSGLQRFAADPAGVAAEHGRLTGKCCFCNRGLRDERSTAVGYGPNCADRFGLPWGAKAAA